MWLYICKYSLFVGPPHIVFLDIHYATGKIMWGQRETSELTEPSTNREAWLYEICSSSGHVVRWSGAQRGVMWRACDPPARLALLALLACTLLSVADAQAAAPDNKLAQGSKLPFNKIIGRQSRSVIREHIRVVDLPFRNIILIFKL